MYDIADHPDFHFRTTDIVIRIGNSENGRNTECENDVSSKNVFNFGCCHVSTFPCGAWSVLCRSTFGLVTDPP